MSNADFGALKVEARSEGDSIVLLPVGDIDLSGQPVLRSELRKALDTRAASRVVVDLSGVPYMDSTGVATLVEGLSMARRVGKKLVLASMQERVRTIFEIARLEIVFSIVPDVQKAMQV